MKDQLKHIDLRSKESRASLTKMVMRLFYLWQITIADQAVLLNRSLSTIRRYRKGQCLPDDKDMLDRIGSFLSIHKSLKILYPQNEDLVYRWITAKNSEFDDQLPIEVMKKNLNGIVKVRSYLEAYLYSGW